MGSFLHDALGEESEAGLLVSDNEVIFLTSSMRRSKKSEAKVADPTG